jgi:nitroreductase
MLTVSEALKTRVSTRAFLDAPLSEALVREILDTARWSPSGGNLQPWKVIAVSGDARQAVIDLARRVRDANFAGEAFDPPVYPANLWEPYRTRRFKVGEALYELLGIPRADKTARQKQFDRNYQFFDAPVGLFFVIDSGMGRGQWSHLGMFMQSVALAALERGVSSCMQEAWASVRGALARHFELPDNEMVYCGMALGYADTSARVNRLRSERAGVDEFARFQGF